MTLRPASLFALVLGLTFTTIGCDAVGPDAAPVAVASACPVLGPCGDDPPPTPPALTVYTTGPGALYLHESAQYTSYPNGGTPPYTYQWSQRMDSGNGNWSYWTNTSTTQSTYASVNSCGIYRMQLRIQVSDTGNRSKTAYQTVDVRNPC